MGREVDALLELNEFNEEAETKEEDKEETGDETITAHAGTVAPQGDECDEEGEVEKRFVELDGVADERRASVCGVKELDAPRESGCCAEDLLVEEVADANECAGKSSRDDHDVQQAAVGVP